MPQLLMAVQRVLWPYSPTTRVTVPIATNAMSPCFLSVVYASPRRQTLVSPLPATALDVNGNC